MLADGTFESSRKRREEVFFQKRRDHRQFPDKHYFGGKIMEKDTIWVVTGETVVTRRGGVKQLKVEELAVDVNLFIEQIRSNRWCRLTHKLALTHFW
jgi:hypothetical protein